MADAGKLAGVADEGGFWPDFDTNEEAIETLLRAIEAAGFKPGAEVAISLDIAASEFGENGQYRLAKDNKTLDSDAMCAMLIDWMERYPIVSIEDPLGEDDPDGLMKFTWAVGDNAQVVGDDVLVTNAERVKAAAKDKLCNSLLCKPNQAGTLSEAKAAFDAAHKAGMGRIVSARSGETEDCTIVHLAVGWGAPQLKVGSFARSERMVKWNEGIRIADTLADKDGPLPPKSAFHWR
jgi:enolase